ncbi:hypothetical protein CRM22_006602 [Opisthorchis felineus]|uniref:UBA domain-containing protein n=1 Tax=Opisthorchis felineus TaxID=147828 RepID=A0A4S2LLW8_OPIFE|nr:hypothetical protein CRM22_006602 [Opisthorchis felineus]
MEKTMRSKTRDFVSVQNGDCLSKMPTATAEQLNIAKILSKPGDEVDLRKYVVQLQELTACTEDQAVTALYDCENNLERAVELLLDKLRFGNDEEWYTTGKKPPRPKHSSPNDSDFICVDAPSQVESDHMDNDKSILSIQNDSQRKDDSCSASTEVAKSEALESVPRKRDNRRRSSASAQKSGGNVDGVIRRTEVSESKSSRPPITDVSEPKPRSRFPVSDAWDPYTEYGEWGGEAIEVINSNASISRGLQEEVVLPDELLVDTDAHDIKASLEQPVESDTHSVNDELSPKSVSFADPDSIFVTKALSKTPPPAFTNLPDAPVFIVPEVLPKSISKWPFKFCGESCSSFKSILTPSLSTNPLSPKENVHRTTQRASTCTSKARAEIEPQDYCQFVPSPSPSKSKATNFDVNKPGGARSLLENPTTSDTKAELVPTTYSTNHFQNVNVAPKVSGTFSAPQKQPPTANFGSDGTSGQSNFLESSLKSYILDNLPSEMNKLSVSEPAQTTKVSQYSLQTSVPQASSSSSFSHNQGGTASSMPHSVNKAQLPHISNHASIHTAQQPTVSSATQAHQQTAPVPPGLPHFIGQFAPPAYMFNLPGGSGNAPTIFDLDQFQLLQQQQRMLYDMHLQHQAATTVQSHLTSTADAPTSSKSMTHSIPGTMGHVTAANAGIRPDMLTSAMGHAPQMMPTGHSYFPYPGFVLMNGYPNAFLNQQQQQSGQDTGPGQGGAGHGSSPITQHQQQPNSSAQSYSGMKSVNTGYDDLFDMKYGDPAKQVGFKNTGNPNYGSFQGQIPSTEVVGSKLSSSAHSTSGVLTQGFNANSGTGQPFSPQFYPSAPYITAAVAVAAAAAASAQQQHQAAHAGGPVAGSANQSNAGAPSVNSSGTQVGGSNALHASNGANQAMILGPSGSNLHAHHHQRSVMPQQY